MATTNNVIHPPKTTEGTVPIILAATPLSNCPSSLEELINIELTEETLPRISSGTYNCKIVERITTLMPSKIPLTNNAVNESHTFFDNPKVIMHIPKPATAYNNIFPWFAVIGLIEIASNTPIAPIEVAAFNQ